MSCTLVAVTKENKTIILTSFPCTGFPEAEKGHFFTLASTEHHGIHIADVEGSLGEIRVQIEFVREALIRLYTQLAMVSASYTDDVRLVRELPDDTTIFLSV